MTMRRSGTGGRTMSEGSISLEIPSSAKPSNAWKDTGSKEELARFKGEQIGGAEGPSCCCP